MYRRNYFSLLVLSGRCNLLQEGPRSFRETVYHCVDFDFGFVAYRYVDFGFGSRFGLQGLQEVRFLVTSMTELKCLLTRLTLPSQSPLQ